MSQNVDQEFEENEELLEELDFCDERMFDALDDQDEEWYNE